MNRIVKKAGLYGLLLVLSGCSWLRPQAPAPQVCPPQVCPVCVSKACPAPRVIEKEKIVTVLPQTAGELNLPIIGEVEHVVVHPSGFQYEARIDTGAESSSIHAENILLLERDGKQFVKFSLLNPETNELVEMERRFQRTVLIKQKDGEPERRYVVKLWFTLGDIKERIDVTLSNRADFTYPLLVGRNLLTDIAIVDVSRRHTINTAKVTRKAMEKVK
jgi:hypothetical protein